MSAFTTAETLYVDWAMSLGGSESVNTVFRKMAMMAVVKLSESGIVGTALSSVLVLPPLPSLPCLIPADCRKDVRATKKLDVITTLTGVDRAQAELNKRYALIKEFSEHARLSGKVTTAFEKAVEGLRFRRCGLRAQEVVPFLHDWRMVLAWAHHIYNMQTCLRLPCTRKSFFASDTLPRELMLDLTRDLFQGSSYMLLSFLVVAVPPANVLLLLLLLLLLMRSQFLDPDDEEEAEADPTSDQEPWHRSGYQDVVYQTPGGSFRGKDTGTLKEFSTLAFVGTPHPKGGIAPYTVSEVQSALGLGRRPRAQTDEEDKVSDFGSGVKVKGSQHQHDLFPYKLFGVRSYLGEWPGSERYEPFTDLPSRVAFARVESELGAEVPISLRRGLGFGLRFRVWGCLVFWDAGFVP
ncbi:unnamed protein product [Symbiodinium sp. KB8]|nr:unnamed protein product [Symbiodinium sp. KB8]